MPTPDRTSLAEIVDAGRGILESAGPSKLTMQAVAERVGVRAPSLYKRVRDRDALLELVAAATVGRPRGPARSIGRFAGRRWPTLPRLRAATPEGFRLMFAVDGAAGAMARASAPVLRATPRTGGPGCCPRRRPPGDRLGDRLREHGAVGIVPLRRGPGPRVRLRPREAFGRPACAVMMHCGAIRATDRSWPSKAGSRRGPAASTPDPRPTS